MYNSSCDYAQKIQEKNAEILRENGISGTFYDISTVLLKRLLFKSEDTGGFLILQINILNHYPE